MRLIPSIRGLFLVGGLLFASSSFANRDLESFEDQEPTESQRDALAAARAQSRIQIAPFGQELAAPEKPFPWIMVFFCVSTILVAAPFALRMYRRTAAEVAEANAFGFKAKAALDAERQ